MKRRGAWLSSTGSHLRSHLMITNTGHVPPRAVSTGTIQVVPSSPTRGTPTARTPGGQEPLAVIRQRTRSDHHYPDIGQMYWEHTPCSAATHEACGTCP